MGFDLFWKELKLQHEFILNQKQHVKQIYQDTTTWGEFFIQCRQELKYPVQFFSVIMLRLCKMLKLPQLVQLLWTVNVQQLKTRIRELEGEVTLIQQTGGGKPSHAHKKWLEWLSFNRIA